MQLRRLLIQFARTASRRRPKLVALLAATALAALLVAAGVAAGADENDSGDHLLVVPNSKRAQKELRDSKAKLVEHYDAFDLVTASGGDAKRLIKAGADRRDDMNRITLPGGSLDPTREPADFTAEGGKSSKPALAVVQFVGPIKDSWLKQVRKDGVRLIGYVPQNGYLVSGRQRHLRRLQDRVGGKGPIRALTPYTDSQKLAGGATETKTVAVQTLSGSDGDDARQLVRKQGRALRADSHVDEFRTQFVTLEDAGQVDEIASQPGVVAVAPYRTPKLRDERASQIVAGNISSGQLTGAGYLAWLSARNLNSSTTPGVVDVTDEGLDNGKIPGKHPDFFVNGVSGAATRIAYLSNYTSDSGRKANRDCGGHGTLNASIATGYNDKTGSTYEDSGLYNYGLGVAPRVKVGSSKIFRCSGAFSLRGTFTQLTSSAYANGARVSNNSWGTDDFGRYSPDDQEFDKLVRDAQPSVAGNQEMVEVFAAGNAGNGAPQEGTIGSPASAKNGIAVGASESVRLMGTDGCQTPDQEANDARDVVPWSSRGPTDDGRVKPDLVAPGTHLTGAQPQHGGYTGDGVCNKRFPSGSTLYSESSGTSHSTPVVAGAAALLRDFFDRTQGSGNGTKFPSAAMVKALLINTATDLGGRSTTPMHAPQDDEGWGLADLGSAFDATTRSFVDQTAILSSVGSTDSHAYTVQDTGKPVKVTLVWTDAPSAVVGVGGLVNNLNLEVDSDGDTYKGNDIDFSTGFSYTPGGADNYNNVESVYLPAGTSGALVVRVTSASLGGDGLPGNGDLTDQDFALVVSNAS